VSASATGARPLEAVHEEETPLEAVQESICTGSPRESKPVLQRAPSGDSFHTCISHESALLRCTNSAQSPGPLQEKIDDENASTTSTQIRSVREVPMRQLPPIERKSLSCQLPLAGSATSADSSFAVSNSMAMVKKESMHSQSAAGQGSRTSRTFGRRISQIRHSLRKSPTDPGQVSRNSKRHSQNGYAHNGQSSPSKKKGNQNMPHDYGWLTELLVMICDNQAGGIGSMDRNSKDALRATPLFVVCGACPSTWAPMQAVLYSAIGQGESSVDFWWTKPRKNAPEILERLTLDRWAKGPYKNDPGRSKSIYKPLADLFTHASKKDDQLFKFGMEAASPGGSCTRAFIEDPRTAPPGRYYLYLVWQEEWTQNPLASNKFIKGKIAYQREPERGVAAVIFLREYCITNGKLQLSEVEEPASEVLPGASLKEIGTL